MVWMEVSNGKEIFCIFYKLHKVVTKLHKQQTLTFSHKYFFPSAVQE